jgi:hypothetical protein
MMTTLGVFSARNEPQLAITVIQVDREDAGTLAACVIALLIGHYVWHH